MKTELTLGKKCRFHIRRGIVSAAIMAALVAPPTATAVASGTQQQPLSTSQSVPPNPVAAVVEITRRPRIQVAIALDTSNSMDGLIDQTRNQLWQVVNEFSSARQDGLEPILEIALFEYGNDGNAAKNGYVRQVSGFTRELDAVSAGLFGLTTNGGSEYCGYTIQSLLEDLQWSQADSDIRTIFIAGNESFAQGPVSYRAAVAQAKRRGISVNTIHAGGHEQGVSDQWQVGAILAGGHYMSIDADQEIAHITAPQDEQIVELNARLNQTYLPYGDAGAASAERQQEQDSASGSISEALLAKRAASKSTAFYRNAGWDLVDALDDGAVDEAKIVEMEEESLPLPMQQLRADERVEYVKQKARQRKALQLQIRELSESREAYVAEKKAEMAVAAPSVSDALTEAIKEQARQKNFTLEN